MRASIIISTYNRCKKLEECLENLNHLDYDNFEVIVVNGPSTDNTRLVCSTYDGKIKYFDCPEINLSVSRNIGISNSSGDICAFIDDDALTHKNWLSSIIKGYESEHVVGVGGFTINHTGNEYQATAVLCDRFGRDYPVYSGLSIDSFCFPGSPLYPSLLGTNCSFRRKSLIAIGGFDETFAYFLDETDVCLRLIDSGGSIKYIPDALIYHRYAESHLRNIENIPKSRYMPLRSQSYFMHRHGSKIKPLDEILEKINKLRIDTKNANRWLLENSKISHSSLSILDSEVDRGLLDGFEIFKNKIKSGDLKISEVHSNFLTYEKKLVNPMRIAFICRNYPPYDTSGIARWTHTLANGVAKLGHQVYVICEAESEPSMDYQDGVWVCRIISKSNDHMIKICDLIDLPAYQLNWSASAFCAIEQIGFNNLDVISAPIWDIEGIITNILSPVPLVTSLHTTYELARPYKPDWINRPVYNMGHVQKICDVEKSLFENCSHFLANSLSIIDDIEKNYGVDINKKSILVPHGVDDVKLIEKFESSVKPLMQYVLFVGRQETRKGFDTAIKASVICANKNKNITFIFAGSPCDDEYCMKEIINIPNNLKSRIIINGYVTDEDLNVLYRNCRIFLAPSRYESFGLVAIEAMRYGKPVIVSSRGGLAEVVNNGKDGIQIDPDDPNKMADVILDMWNSQSKCDTLGCAARNSYERKYTTEIMVNNAVAAYKEFIKK
jgi:glycogen(starch) synthase